MKSSETILITGGTGYLGGELVKQAARQFARVAATYHTQPPPASSEVTWLPLDVTDAPSVAETFEQMRPDVVIHTAFRQYDPGLMAVTAEGTAHVAQAAAAVNARLVHISSDVIFDGEQEAPYSETDPPAPISDYGAAKAAAEAHALEACPGAAVVRTSLIYGIEEPFDIHTRFVLSLIDGERDAVLFSDEYRCPIFVGDLATALLELGQTTYAGVLNIAGAERVSRYQFGQFLAAAHGRDPSLLRAGRNAESGLRRPRNCTLDISRARTLLLTPLRGVSEVLAGPNRDAKSNTKHET